MFTVTENAWNRLKEVLVGERAGQSLRIAVVGGGCAGYSYSYTLDTIPAEDDIVLKCEADLSMSIFIDSASLTFLDGAALDYVDDLTGAHFTIINPNAKNTCGCGSSFS